MADTPQDAPPCPDRQTWRGRLIHRIARCDTPHRTAAAFAFGVFLSFSPFLGLQIILGMALAFPLRLSRVSMFAGLCTNLPWIMVPWYTLTTVAAAATLGTPIGPEVRNGFAQLTELPVYRSVFWTHAYDIIAPFFWSFMIGPTLGAIVIGAVAYVLVVRLVQRIQATPTPSELVAE